MSPRRAAADLSDSRFERPPGFVFRDERESRRGGERSRVLYCENVSLTKLAQRYKTPLYVYSSTAIRARVSAFERAFSGFPHTICYSVKANSNLAILRLLAREGCGFDVVSGGELERVLIANRRVARRTVFSGVGKSSEEIAAGLKAGILLFNVESESELSVVAECAARLRTVAPVAMRVNPDVDAKTHPYISTGLHKHKFGVPIGKARQLYTIAAKTKYLKVAGVSVHIGSQIIAIDPFAEAVARVAELVRQLRDDGHDIVYVDIGGGLGIEYENPGSDFAKYAARYARAVTDPLRAAHVHLLLEPGRAIVGSAGVLLTRVLYRKQNDGKKFVVVDAAMNDLIRPALYGAYHEIVPVTQSGQATQERHAIDVVGPICESGDSFARDRELPNVKEGDLLGILDTGAYGMVLASNYNTRARAAEVLVSGKSAKLVRRRESLREMLSSEM